MWAISVRQPWASLIVSGYKTIENRDYQPRVLRPGELLLIHAGKRVETGLEAFDFPCLQGEGRGGIVGCVRYAGLVDWWTGWPLRAPELTQRTFFLDPKRKFHWGLEAAQVIPFFPYRGRQGLFWVEYPEWWSLRCGGR